MNLNNIAWLMILVSNKGEKDSYDDDNDHVDDDDNDYDDDDNLLHFPNPIRILLGSYRPD